MNRLHVAMGEGPDGMPFLCLADERSLYVMTPQDARGLAAQLLRVADNYEQMFRTEVVVTYSGLASGPR